MGEKMQVLGKYNVTKEAIFRATILCHALDVALPNLNQLFPNICQGSWQCSEYERTLSETLLHLAIVLRSSINLGLDHSASLPYISGCGFLFSKNETLEFTVKDVCDKIIHA